MRPPLTLLMVSVAVGVALSSGATARAESPTTGAWPGTVVHAGRIEGDHVTWQSSFLDNSSVDSSAPWERIDLARPVVAELDASRSPGVAAIMDSKGELVAFAVDAHRLPAWRDEVKVTLRAPLAHDGDAVLLNPPLARGESVQRLDVAGDGDLRFEPEPSIGLVHNVGSWSTPGISEGARHETNIRLGGRDTSLDESPIYVNATSPALEHGLRGRALTEKERARPGLILAVLVFLLLGAGCAAAYRLLGRDARIEQAEAVLREEFERHGS